MTDAHNGAPVEILLVEDNAADADLMRIMLRKWKAPINLRVARDGVEALTMLGRKGEFANAPRPNLIMLDLNLPKLHGHEVLATVKTDPQLKRIPVVIVTSSKSQEDVARSYDLHANCYITKPAHLDEFKAAVAVIEEFWFSVAQLPSVA